MDPHTVTTLVRQRQNELLAEAQRERLASGLRSPRTRPRFLSALAEAIRRLRAPGRSARIGPRNFRRAR